MNHIKLCPFSFIQACLCSGLCLLLCVNNFALADTGSINQSAIEQSIREALPNTKITSIQASPIEGLVEIVAGRNVLYAGASGRYLVVGSLYNMHTATDLTAERKTSTAAIDWDSLPLDSAVKYAGSGPHKLAVFFDPDCPWCKKLHHQLASLKDIQVYAILYPVATLHPNAKSKATGILCSADPLQALDTVMEGKTLPTNNDRTCMEQAATSITKVETFANAHNIRGTPTLVAADGRVRAGFLDEQALRAWLDASLR